MDEESQIPKLGETRELDESERMIYALFAHEHSYALIAEMDFNSGKAYVYHSAGKETPAGWAEIDIHRFVMAGGFPIEFAKPLPFPKAKMLGDMFERETKIRINAEKAYSAFSGAVRRMVMTNDSEPITDEDRKMLSFLDD